jgi:hypothetical protein
MQHWELLLQFDFMRLITGLAGEFSEEFDHTLLQEKGPISDLLKGARFWISCQINLFALASLT